MQVMGDELLEILETQRRLDHQLTSPANRSSLRETARGMSTATEGQLTTASSSNVTVHINSPHLYVHVSDQHVTQLTSILCRHAHFEKTLCHLHMLICYPQHTHVY